MFSDSCNAKILNGGVNQQLIYSNGRKLEREIINSSNKTKTCDKILVKRSGHIPVCPKVNDAQNNSYTSLRVREWESTLRNVWKVVNVLSHKTDQLGQILLWISSLLFFKGPHMPSVIHHMAQANWQTLRWKAYLHFVS